MTYATPASVEILAQVAVAGPRDLDALAANPRDIDDRNRVAVLAYKLCQRGALCRVAPGVFDLGPAAPWWALRLREWRPTTPAHTDDGR